MEIDSVDERVRVLTAVFAARHALKCWATFLHGGKIEQWLLGLSALSAIDFERFRIETQMVLLRLGVCGCVQRCYDCSGVNTKLSSYLEMHLCKIAADYCITDCTCAEQAMWSCALKNIDAFVQTL